MLPLKYTTCKDSFLFGVVTIENSDFSDIKPDSHIDYIDVPFTKLITVEHYIIHQKKRPNPKSDRLNFKYQQTSLAQAVA